MYEKYSQVLHLLLVVLTIVGIMMNELGALLGAWRPSSGLWIPIAILGRQLIAFLATV